MMDKENFEVELAKHIASYKLQVESYKQRYEMMNSIVKGLTQEHADICQQLNEIGYNIVNSKIVKKV